MPRLRSTIAIVFLLLAPGRLSAAGEPRSLPGFDYYVLSLSWSPQYCADSRGNRDQRQCGGHRPYAFVLHGLWPQNERGFPSSCAPPGSLPRAVVDGMLDVMPSPSLVRHEWEAHGTCTGLSPEAFFSKARQAFASVAIPDRFRAPVREVYVDPHDIVGDFLRANPALPPAGIAVLCSGRYLREVRICLDRSLHPRPCGRDVRSGCRGEEVIVRPLR